MSTAIPNLFPALDSATEAALRESIQRFGVLVPVVRDQHGRTLDGHHRSRLGDEMKVQYRVDVVNVESDEQAREIAATLNTDRRQLDATQRRDVVAALREQGHSLRAIAGAVGVSHEQVRTDVSTVNDLTVPDRVVGLDGKSRPTVVTAKNQREADRAQAALVAVPLDSDEHTVSAADVVRTASTARKRARTDALATTNPVTAATGVFSVLCADPPWRYEANATPDKRSIENHYPTMTADELAALAIPAADDAVLFMWATSPKLAEALSLMGAWDFDYRTCMVWVKDKIGMGYYARQQHELLLIGKRGNIAPPEPADRPSSVIAAPRGQHSAKPAEAYALIERMYPTFARVELFARGAREGWTVWGNEAQAAA